MATNAAPPMVTRSPYNVDDDDEFAPVGDARASDLNEEALNIMLPSTGLSHTSLTLAGINVAWLVVDC